MPEILPNRRQSLGDSIRQNRNTVAQLRPQTTVAQRRVRVVATPKVAMATGLGHHRSRRIDPRPDQQAAVDGPRQVRVGAAGITNGGEPLEEVALRRVPRHRTDDPRMGFEELVFGHGEGQVGVDVDEPGSQNSPAAIDHLGPRGRFDFVGRDLLDVTPDHQDFTGLQLGIEPIEDADVTKKDRLVRRHGSRQTGHGDGEGQA